MVLPLLDVESPINRSVNSNNNEENSCPERFNTVLGSLSTNSDLNHINSKNPVNSHDVGSILKCIRIKNINRLIIGNLNINSISGKFEQLKTVICGNIDILVVVETKLDDTFPDSQFFIEGYSTPFRLDRNRNRGGVLIYVR